MERRNSQFEIANIDSQFKDQREVDREIITPTGLHEDQIDTRLGKKFVLGLLRIYNGSTPNS